MANLGLTVAKKGGTLKKSLIEIELAMMKNKIACSAEQLGLFDPQMIQSVVETNAFRIGCEYVAETVFASWKPMIRKSRRPSSAIPAFMNRLSV